MQIYLSIYNNDIFGVQSMRYRRRDQLNAVYEYNMASVVTVQVES